LITDIIQFFFENQLPSSNYSNDSIDEKTHILKLADSVLINLTSSFVGSSVGFRLLARVKFELGEVLAAEKAMLSSIKLNPNDALAHLLMAEINLFNQHIQPASDSLESALSQDFAIKNNIRYLLLKSKVLKGQNKYEEAITLLSGLMNSGGVKELLSSKKYYLKRRLSTENI
jgi:tetratricopeptide repeat protein 21B